jgi:hypothetical protein
LLSDGHFRAVTPSSQPAAGRKAGLRSFAIGFNETGWLDGFGHSHPERMQITEHYRRGFGHMHF